MLAASNSNSNAIGIELGSGEIGSGEIGSGEIGSGSSPQGSFLMFPKE